MDTRRGWIHNYISFSGLSEEDVEAAEALDVLRNSHVDADVEVEEDRSKKRIRDGEDEDGGHVRRRKASVRDRSDSRMSQLSNVSNASTEERVVRVNSHEDSQSKRQEEESLFDKVCRNSNEILTNMGSFFEEMNSNVFMEGGSDVPEEHPNGYVRPRRDSHSISTTGADADTESQGTQGSYNGKWDTWSSRSYNDRQYYSKRKALSEALAKGRYNLREYKLTMSIESKKRLITCLHLLKLANKQLSDKVAYLQDAVEKEQELANGEEVKKETRALNGEHSGAQNDDDLEFYDASESVDQNSGDLGLEIVGTVKKVYSLISKYTGSSLPEPARSQVRESLLNLPSNWNTSVHNGFKNNGTGIMTASSSTDSLSSYSSILPVSSNGKYLILAKESLNMVQSVIDVVDSTLGRAEEWVKQKQELKEMIKKKFLEQQEHQKMLGIGTESLDQNESSVKKEQPTTHISISSITNSTNTLDTVKEEDMHLQKV